VRTLAREAPFCVSLDFVGFRWISLDFVDSEQASADWARREAVSEDPYRCRSPPTAFATAFAVF
jgi:hypothetical protein